MKDKFIIVFTILLAAILHAFIIKPESQRYEVVSLNETNYVIIDNKEDKIYQKFISPNQGPTEFKEIELP